MRSRPARSQDDRIDRGAHDPFDDQAHDRDPVLWLSMHRRAVLAGTAVVAGAAAAGSALLPCFGATRR